MTTQYWFSACVIHLAVSFIKKYIGKTVSWAKSRGQKEITDNFRSFTETFYILFVGILGYKIHFDANGDAEFNLTLLDMQAMRKLNNCFYVLIDWASTETFE